MFGVWKLPTGDNLGKNNISYIIHFRLITILITCLTLFGSASENYFEVQAMGYENVVHYWHLKKAIGSLDAF